jgi:agmatinase
MGLNFTNYFDLILEKGNWLIVSKTYVGLKANDKIRKLSMKMSIEKLEKIRAAAEKSDFNDNRLNELFSQSEEDAESEGAIAPYAGFSSFLKAPQSEDLTSIDIALIGIPFDLGVTNRPGARFGPQQIRQLSSMAVGPMHHESRIIPQLLCNYADIGDVPLNTFNLEAGIATIESYFNKVVDAGVVPISAGGDHSVTYPILKALGRNEPVGLIHIDAHCDTGGAFNGSKFHHGGPFRTAALDGVLDPERTIQIGIRGRAEPHWDFSYDTGMRVIHVEEFYKMGIEGVIAEARKVVGDGPTYISFDVDAIDPAFTPGTGTPEIGGLTPIDVQQLIRGFRGLNIVGADVVEVSPPFDPLGNTALVAATMMWELLCITAESVDHRKK